MANVQKAERSSTFTIVAAVLAVSLLAAGGLSYLQSAERPDSVPGSLKLAALSQAIPLHSSSALSGSSLGFVRLKNDLSELASLGNMEAQLGGRAPWQEMQSLGDKILEQRSVVEEAYAAADFVKEHMPRLLEAGSDLFATLPATDVSLEFQSRAISLAQGLASFPGSNAPVSVADNANNDVRYLRAVAAALNGEPSNVKVAALTENVRAAALEPLLFVLTDIEARVGQVSDAAVQLTEVRATQEQLLSVAFGLFNSSFSVADTALPATLGSPLLIYVFMAIALLALAGLVVLHAQTAVFKRTSEVQTQQNERNQQAILRLLDELGSLADGDLTAEATVTEDITGAIADSINYAIEKLRELVATINDTAIMLDGAAKQTKSSASNMKRAAENQAREISAATDSIVSMAASIEEVSGNAERSSDVARHSVDVAHKGGDAVRRTIDGMNTIRETIQETSKRIKRLGESSQEIGNIVELINDIAEQTNILALNASIQASMAGEAGRGFAVVADEVQRLAERSTNATKQIEVLVRTIQADTNEAVISMERSTTDVVGGALLAENAGAALDEIEQVSNQIASLVQNISGSAQEQASSAADVTKRTTRLKEISEEASKATGATAASIGKLSELASQLRNTVDGFTLPSVDGSGTLPGTTASSSDKGTS